MSTERYVVRYEGRETGRFTVLDRVLRAKQNYSACYALSSPTWPRPLDDWRRKQDELPGPPQGDPGESSNSA